jgi:hypothetical protein
MSMYMFMCMFVSHVHVRARVHVHVHCSAQDGYTNQLELSNKKTAIMSYCGAPAFITPIYSTVLLVQWVIRLLPTYAGSCSRPGVSHPSGTGISC